MEDKKFNRPTVKHELISQKEDLEYNPYFIIRYGYLNPENLTQNDQQSYDYESIDQFSDTITIFTENGSYYSHLENIGYALITNHKLKTEDLPSQYSPEKSVAIITHELAHSFIELVINKCFKSLIHTSENHSYSALGEGLALGLQDVGLGIRTHYTTYEFVPYTIIGKAFFRWLEDERKKASIKPISEEIICQAEIIKSKFYPLRDEFIRANIEHSNATTQTETDIIAHPNYLSYKPLFEKYQPDKIFWKYLFPEFKYIVDRCLNNDSPDNIASRHASLGAGYISYYFLNYNEHKKLMDKVAQGTIQFYKSLNKLQRLKVTNELIGHYEKTDDLYLDLIFSNFKTIVSDKDKFQCLVTKI